MTVTPNLGAALQRLRHRFRRRTVWIDALCINQNDLEERAQQVSFMKDIYARAKHVAVWLEDNNVDAQRSASNATTAISIIQQCAKYAYKEIGLGNRLTSHLATIPREDRYSDLKLERKIPQYGDIKWEAVWWFYQLPWFSRVWIIQEIREDARATMFIGSDSVPWWDVVRASLWIFKNGYYLESSRITPQLLLRPSVIIGSIYNNPESSLFHLLTRYTLVLFSATDPRDKVFALLSLSCEEDDMRHPLTRPDYGKSTQRIFGDVIRYLVSKPSTPFSTPRLDALGLGCIEDDISLGSAWPVEGTESPEDEAEEPFPSWVPRWDKGVQFYGCLSCSRLALEWVTSGDSVTEMGNHNSHSSLVLRGLRVSAVSIIDRSLHCTEDQILDGKLSGLLRNLLRKSIEYLPRHEGPDTVEEAFTAAILAGNVKDEETLAQFVYSDVEKYISSIKNGIHQTQLVDFENAIRFNYTIFFTEDGHIGCGPSKMKVGDEVLLLFGGRILYVLRPKDAHHQFIGECYVHGYMHGKAMEMWEAGTLKDEWVDLQ
jgi:hypothetical protein